MKQLTDAGADVNSRDTAAKRTDSDLRQKKLIRKRINVVPKAILSRLLICLPFAFLDNITVKPIIAS